MLKHSPTIEYIALQINDHSNLTLALSHISDENLEFFPIRRESLVFLSFGFYIIFNNLSFFIIKTFVSLAQRNKDYLQEPYDRHYI